MHACSTSCSLRGRAVAAEYETRCRLRRWLARSEVTLRSAQGFDREAENKHKTHAPRGVADDTRGQVLGAKLC